MDLKYFSYIQTDVISKYTNRRAGESKVGEVISYGLNYDSESIQFVIVGISESIGVKGNLGIAGTHTSWEAFLKSFINVQHTDKLNATKIHLLGNFNFDSLFESCSSTEDFRKATQEVDDAVYPLIQEIISRGKIPIVIGGSHANAYPLIKACSLAKQMGIAAINLDAHADFRALEGRHSGNPFSYSYQEQYLSKYAVIGLHENYNSQVMLNEMDKNSIHYTSWEDIYLRKKFDFSTVIEKYIHALSTYPCGIELDLDSISNTLSSAMGPSGFTVTEARQYAYRMAQHPMAAYLHLCEASTELENGLRSSTNGKLLSYLVTDFIKGKLES